MSEIKQNETRFMSFPLYVLVAQTLCCLLVQSLALAHADVDDGKVVFVPWVETDFRTGEDPWWA